MSTDITVRLDATTVIRTSDRLIDDYNGLPPFRVMQVGLRDGMEYVSLAFPSRDDAAAVDILNRLGYAIDELRTAALARIATAEAAA